MVNCGPLSSLISPVTRGLCGGVEAELVQAVAARDNLQELKERLPRIKKFINDAEWEALHDEAVEAVRDKMRCILYEAEDVIDECVIAGMRPNDIDKGPSDPVVGHDSSSCFICFRAGKFKEEICSAIRRPFFSCRMSDKLRNLSASVDKILIESDKFGLRGSDRPKEFSCSGENTSALPPFHLVGRAKDIDLLMRKITTNNNSERGLDVLAIVGMGGEGKTTLAQMIFKDSRIDLHFDKKIWVSASKDSKEEEIMEKIMKGDKEKVEEGRGGELKDNVYETLRNKKIFLVLDNLWHNNTLCRELERVLQGVKPGSKILITTRNEEVARGMGARDDEFHKIRKLSDEDGLELLKMIVGFRPEDMRNERFSDLIDIGKEIVRKCEGLPLAVTVISSVLKQKRKEKDGWNEVLRRWLTMAEKNIKEELMIPLYLSYEDLEYDAKQCFLYCSNYPFKLIRPIGFTIDCWIAEGFIVKEEGFSLEESGSRCFNELVARNLFQLSKETDKKYTIHDSLQELGRHLTRTIKRNRDSKMLTLWVHLPFDKNMPFAHENNSVILKAKYMRALFAWGNQCVKENLKLINFRRFKRLRVLHFDAIDCPPNLIKSIKYLVHLRLLRLTGSSIESLPKSLGNLRNLQVLFLKECKKLCSIPNEITKLKDLRILSTYRCEKLDEMPSGLGGLKELREMCFVVGNNSNQNRGACRILELEPLQNLSMLSIRKLERAKSEDLAKRRLLLNKSQLKTLLLNSEPEGGVDGSEATKGLYEALHPPPSVENFQFDGFSAPQWPNWMLSCGQYLPKLRELYLYDFNYCEVLPPLRQLRNLTEIHIVNAGAVKELVLGEHGSAETLHPRFPQLKSLYLVNMPNLERWESAGDLHLSGGSPALSPLPLLEHIHIEGCPRLKSLPDEFGSSPLLAKLVLFRNSSLEKIPDIPSLKELHVIDCPALCDVKGLQQLRLLYFETEGDTLETPPPWLKSLACIRHGSLRKLYLVGATGGWFTGGDPLVYGGLDRVVTVGGIEILNTDKSKKLWITHKRNGNVITREIRSNFPEEHITRHELQLSDDGEEVTDLASTSHA